MSNPYTDPQQQPAQPAQPAQPVGEPAKKKMSKKQKILIGVGVFVGLGIIGSFLPDPETQKEDSAASETVASATTHTESETVEQTTSEAPAPETTAPAVEEKPADDPAPAPKNEPEKVSREFKNATKKAQQYSDRQHMSRAGLIDQLTSEFGEGFPMDAALYAVDHITVDYNKNALEKARQYSERQSMSNAQVYEQLISQFGEQFTPEQAQYAVDNLDQ